jgi:hypothetical protein
MYIEIPTLESFINELRSLRTKEVRYVNSYNQLPTQPVATIVKTVILTAVSGNDILIHKENIADAPIVVKEKLEEAEKKTGEFITLLIKRMKDMKILAKEGIYKYPSEMGA